MKSTLMLTLGMAATAVNGQGYDYTTTSQYGVQPTSMPHMSSGYYSYSDSPAKMSSSYGLPFHPYPIMSSSSSSSSSSAVISESALPVLSSSLSLQLSSSTSLSPPSSATVISSVWQPSPYDSAMTSQSALRTASAEQTHDTGLPSSSHLPPSVSSSTTSTASTTTTTTTQATIPCTHSSYAWNTTTTVQSQSSTCPLTLCASTVVTSTALPVGSSTTAFASYGGPVTSSSGPVLSGQSSAAKPRYALAAFFMAFVFGAAIVL